LAGISGRAVATVFLKAIIVYNANGLACLCLDTTQFLLYITRIRRVLIWKYKNYIDAEAIWLTTNLKDKVYESLRKKILSGEIKPGDFLMETVLANMYSVSRTPVREALNLIQKEGLIIPLPHNGFIVKKSDTKDLMDLFYIRIILESGAANLAAKKITDKDIKELEKYIDYPDSDSFIEQNNRFHTLIAERSGNEKLCQLIKTALDEITWILNLDDSTKIDEDDTEHIAIINCLQKRDSVAAMAAMKDHLYKTKLRIQRRLNEDDLEGLI